ncbi:glycosyltransferase family 4 protein [Luedemannella helvata]|uniref:Glycosyltransferase family 4 protein n=1 Tax=Luedemannella helvata TaxID=349315 RepID=A0ABP4XGK6_9ACTN
MNGADAGTGGRDVALVLGSSTGGIGRHVASLAAGLLARGDAVTVYSPAETERQFDFAGLGATHVALEIPASPRPADARAVAALRRGLADRPAGVIHAHGLRAGLVAALARRNGTPLVVTWHNAVLGRGVKAKALAVAERYVARSADLNLGASADLVDRARELGGRDVRLGPVAAPILPAPARTRDQVRAELNAGDGPLVLSVGRLHPQKGYDLLVTAAARWRELRPAPTVAIAGTGPAYRKLAAQISTTRAPVLLLGHRTDVADLLAAADLAVVSSVWEARQLFAQEALVAGAPLVATAVGGLPGLVGDAAVLVPAGDVDALDTAVRDLLGDAQRRAELSAAARRQAASWPTEADTISMISDLYDELGAAAGGSSEEPAAGGRD